MMEAFENDCIAYVDNIMNELRRLYDKDNDFGSNDDDKDNDDGINANESEDDETFYDYVTDVLDIEYRVDSKKEYKDVCICIAVGGPNIYIDTGCGKVKLYWGTTHIEKCVLPDICEEIDNIYEELYFC